MVGRKFLGIGRTAASLEVHQGELARPVTKDPRAVVTELPILFHGPLPDSDLPGEGKIIVGKLQDEFASRGSFDEEGRSEIRIAPARVDPLRGDGGIVKKQRKQLFDLSIHRFSSVMI